MSKWKLVPVEATDQMIDAALDAKIGGKVLSCAEIYCAMLDAAPVPVGDDCDDILDCYAAESQQFSDEIVSLRASVESARTKAIALESRRDAWRDSAILSQRSASELARQVDQQAAELARLDAEAARLERLQTAANLALWHAVAPLATTVERCDELIEELSPGFVTYKLRVVRDALVHGQPLTPFFMNPELP